MPDKFFSETQFVFHFMLEILQKYKSLGLPFFPNLRQEKTLGYDAMIDGSIFLQFKIPKYLKREKCYQIKLDTAGKQFKVLCNLKKPANNVCYVSPQFHLRKELEHHFNSNKIEENSAFLPIENFPTNGKRHKRLTYVHISFGIEYGHLHSELELLAIARSINWHQSSPNYKPDQMPISEKAKHLWNFVTEADTSANNRFEIDGVESVFSSLLTGYNILWIPILTFTA